jgi:radical SAM-linked protein
VQLPSPDEREAAPDPGEVAPRRLRLTYAKTGPAAYLGHLDLVRHLPRILRRAGLRPAYTRGYNPRPRLQFAPPLPLGAEARAEPCEAWLVDSGDPPPERELLAALARASLPGLTFTAARWLAADEPALSKLCHGADFRWTFADPPASQQLGAQLAALRARSCWTVQRRSRKKRRAAPAREVDLRESLVRLDAETDEDQGPILVFSLVQTAAGALRAREVVTAVTGEEEPGGRLLRLGHFTLDEKSQRHGIP